jgi:hypothetical protein
LLGIPFLRCDCLFYDRWDIWLSINMTSYELMSSFVHDNSY